MRAIGGHGEHTERIDLRLYDDVGKADDTVLDAGGKTVAHDLAEHTGVEADAARRDGVDLALFEQVDEAEHAARALRDDGRHGGGPHAPAERADEQKVERDVDKRGDDEVVQRAAAVAKGVQNARAHIVEHGRQHAEEVIAEVFDRLRHDLRVRVHPDEERRREADADDRQRRARDDAEGKVRMNGARDVFIVARAKVFGDGDARAHGCADKQTGEQHDERTRRADGGEGVRAEVLAYDERIRCAVELLKDLTDENGQRKAQNQGDIAPLGHILDGGFADRSRLCHVALSFSVPRWDNLLSISHISAAEKGKAPRERCFSSNPEETADKHLTNS